MSHLFAYCDEIANSQLVPEVRNSIALLRRYMLVIIDLCLERREKRNAFQPAYSGNADTDSHTDTDEFESCTSVYSERRCHTALGECSNVSSMRI